MTIEEKKEWLNRYRDSVNRANEIARDIAEYSYIKGVNYNLGNTRNKSARHDLAFDAIKLDNLKREYLEECRESMRIYHSILDALQTVDDAGDPEGWLILFLRHLRLKQFDDIVLSTGRARVTVYRIYERTLTELEIVHETD